MVAYCNKVKADSRFKSNKQQYFTFKKKIIGYNIYSLMLVNKL